MLLDQIISDLKEATYKQEPLVLKTIRFILSAIRYEEIEKKRKLTDEEIVVLLRKEIKKREEALVLIKKGGRNDLVEEEEKKIEVIKRYLPKEMSEEEILEIIKEERSKMPQVSAGQLIGVVIRRVGGKADGARVAFLVRKELGL